MLVDETGKEIHPPCGSTVTYDNITQTFVVEIRSLALVSEEEVKRILQTRREVIRIREVVNKRIQVVSHVGDD